MGNRKQNIEESIKKFREMVNTIHHGSITLVIQDGFIVQIDEKRKTRLK